MIIGEGHVMVQAVDPVFCRAFAATDTRDADAHARCLTGWRQPTYVHVGRQPFSGRISELCLWPVQIIHERIDQPCLYRGSAWSGALIFLSNIASPTSINVSGRQINESAVSIFPWDISDSAYLRGPTNVVSIIVHDSALAGHAKHMLGREISRASLRRTISVDDRELVSAFQIFASGILLELAHDPRLLERESYQTTVRDRTLDLLVRVFDASQLSARPLSPPSTRSYVVEKAAQYMDARLADPLEISDVCEAVRVSPRTLRYSFEEMVGMSPTEYLLARRLGGVRRDLLQSGTPGRIHCIAERHGFAHMGRFSRFYFDAFGERPSDTCRRRRPPIPVGKNQHPGAVTS
jgi:AraC family transcriptional regulator, ethanolamine operon transcriptional activator